MFNEKCKLTFKFRRKIKYALRRNRYFRRKVMLEFCKVPWVRPAGRRVVPSGTQTRLRDADKESVLLPTT
eukprot:scaffold79072_cov28-Prasinocladus_malaysianus.AAC.1